MLYTQGREMRLAQELVLGIGGARALAALGIEPRVWHMNEGHSALLQFERLRRAPRLAAPTSAAAVAEPAPHLGLHHPHAGARRQRSLRGRARAQVPRALAAGTGLDLERWLALGNNDHGRARTSRST